MKRSHLFCELFIDYILRTRNTKEEDLSKFKVSQPLKKVLQKHLWDLWAQTRPGGKEKFLASEDERKAKMEKEWTNKGNIKKFYFQISGWKSCNENALTIQRGVSLFSSVFSCRLNCNFYKC